MLRKILIVFTVFSFIFATQNIQTKVTTKDVAQIDVTMIALGADSCLPCKMMRPIMDSAEKEYSNVKIIFYDVSTPWGRPFAMKYGIRSIPTQIFFDKNGEEYFRHVGFFPKADLVKVLEEGFKR